MNEIFTLAFMLGPMLIGAVCFIVYTVAHHRLQRERLDAQTDLKRELIQRGLPPQELEQALKLLKLDETPETPQTTAQRRFQGMTDQDLVGEVIERLAVLDGISPQSLEQVIGLVRAADYDTKGAAVNLVTSLAENAEAEVVLAAVRALCRPAEKPRHDIKPLELSEHFTR